MPDFDITPAILPQHSGVIMPSLMLGVSGESKMDEPLSSDEEMYSQQHVPSAGMITPMASQHSDPMTHFDEEMYTKGTNQTSKGGDDEEDSCAFEC